MQKTSGLSRRNFILRGSVASGGLLMAGRTNAELAPAPLLWLFILAASTHKALFIISGATHRDLYDGAGAMAAAKKLVPLFKRQLV